MPTYDFKNKETGEIVTQNLSFSGKDEYLKANPYMTQVHLSSPKLIRNSDGDVLKAAGDGWKDVQNRIKSGMPPRLRDNIRTK